MTKEIKIAVLGTGSIGSRHLRVLRSIPGVTPIAVPLRSERLAELKESGFLTALNIRASADAGVSHLVVATDTARHVEDALTGLGLGMDVLVEKPLSFDAASCGRLKTAAAASEKKVFVGCVMRFTDSLAAFQEKLPEIGAVYSARVECQSYLPDWRPGRDYRQSYSARQNEGGVLRDLIHEIDMAGKIFGWPEQLQGALRNRGFLGIESEEIAEMFWETPNGCSVSFCLDYLSRVPRRIVRAFGDRGVLEWDGIANKVTLEMPNAESRTEIFPQSRDDTFLKQAEAFLRLPGADAERLACLEEGILGMKILDAARISSVEARGIRL